MSQFTPDQLFAGVGLTTATEYSELPKGMYRFLTGVTSSTLQLRHGDSTNALNTQGYVLGFTVPLGQCISEIITPQTWLTPTIPAGSTLSIQLLYLIV